MWEACFAFHICIACCEFLWCQIIQRAVWPYLVVIDSPPFDGLPRIVQSEEPVFVQAHLAELAVEAFGPSRCDEVQCDLVLIGPLVQSPGGELRAVINNDPQRHSTFMPKL